MKAFGVARLPRHRRKHLGAAGICMGAVVLIFLVPVELFAKRAPAFQTDTRGSPGAGVAVSPAPIVDRQALERAWQRFRGEHGGIWRISWNDRSGLPSMIYGGRTHPYAGTPEEAAVRFVNDHRELLGLSDPRHSLRLVEKREVRNGVVRVTLQQQFQGIDVFDGTIHVLIDGVGTIYHITNSAWPVSDVDLSMDLGEAAAGASIERRFAGSSVVYTEQTRRVIYPSANGRLAYLAYALIGTQRVPWRVLIDAQTGEILRERRLVFDESILTGGVAERGVGESVAFDPNDACDREWTLRGDEVSLTETAPDSDTYAVEISVGVPGRDEFDFHPSGDYAAGIKLLPCVRYKITVSCTAATWGAYTTAGGYARWDVFYANVNSSNYYWNLQGGTIMPAVDHSCDSQLDTTGVVLPGKTLTLGGERCFDGNLCQLSASPVEIEYLEPDPAKEVYLSVGMERFVHECPSWGTFNVTIEAKSYVFDPNPVTTKNEAFADQIDSNAAIPCDAYFPVTLSQLTTPLQGNPWKLTGTYVEIKDIETPAKAYPTSRQPHFPYIRRCDAFEAVMAYFHISLNQLYIQSLGFFNVNNRRHDVDPHGVDGEDNSHYVAVPVGAGYLAFGEGGVDDAEDADVILHEYGHSIQDNQTTGIYFGNGNNGFGDETGAMGEGFGDYWACSNFYSQSIASGFDPAAFAEWDAENLNGLRRVDEPNVYPDSMVDEVHADGETWSACLWDLFDVFGQQKTDVLVLKSHFLVPADPKFTDGAKAILAADAIAYGSADEDSIIAVFLDRGIFHQVTVESAPAGAIITASKTDCRGDGGGLTPFDHIYGWGDTVLVTAPLTHSGVYFIRWVVDGANLADGLRSVPLRMNEDHVAKAVYIGEPTSVRPEKPVLALHQNFPNPFNPGTSISFGVPEDAEVDLSIYDVEGKLVRVVRSGWAKAGYQQVHWDGTDSRGRPVASGIYVYRLKVGRETLTQKMALVR